MASSFKAIMESLAAAFQSACEPYRTGYTMTIRTDGERKQTIRSLMKTNREGRQVLLFYTQVGQFDTCVDLQGLLAENLETLYARVALYDQQIIVVAGSLLEETSIAQAKVAIEEVARVGDRLEHEIFGVDVH